MEQWKDIAGYEGLYQASNHGRVKSLDRVVSDGRRWKGRIMKLSSNTQGYLKINLCKDGKAIQFAVHRLVAMAFIPNPEDKPEVNHIDRDKTNNHVSNLEWCTPEENVNHAMETGYLLSTLEAKKSIMKAIAEEEKPNAGELSREHGFTLNYVYRLIREHKAVS